MANPHGEFFLSHPLDAIYAKIERANEQLQRFNGEINAYLTSDPPPYSIVGNLDSQGTHYRFHATGKTQPPIRFPILAGEIIQQLRSSLDYLVVALAGLNGQHPLNNHQFPVCRTPEKFEKAASGGIMKGVGRAALDKIIAAQPYNNAAPDTYTLAAIHDLNIRDKHRLLVVISVAVQLGDTVTIGTREGSHPTIVGLSPPWPAIVTEAGTEVFYIELAEPCFDFYANAEFASQIAFDKVGSAEIVDVIPALATMIGFTTELVGSFADAFPQR